MAHVGGMVLGFGGRSEASGPAEAAFVRLHPPLCAAAVPAAAGGDGGSNGGGITGQRNGYAFCLPCSRGTRRVFVNGSATCVGCPPGTYSDRVGAGECTACPAGTFFGGTFGGDRSVCTLCGVGTYRASEGAARCEACAGAGACAVLGSTAAGTGGGNATNASNGAAVGAAGGAASERLRSEQPQPLQRRTQLVFRAQVFSGVAAGGAVLVTTLVLIVLQRYTRVELRRIDFFYVEHHRYRAHAALKRWQSATKERMESRRGEKEGGDQRHRAAVGAGGVAVPRGCRWGWSPITAAAAARVTSAAAIAAARGGRRQPPSTTTGMVWRSRRWRQCGSCSGPCSR